MKRIVLWILILSTVVISWCGTTSTNTIQVQDFSFALPTTFQSISSNSLDQAQIAHSIISAWKWDGNTLILSESSLPGQITLQQFTQDTQSRLNQNMIWYNNGKISSTSFTCNWTKIPAYKHIFNQTELQDTKKIIMYFDQLYFVYNKNVYILSLAHQAENSIFSDIIWTLWCVAKK